MSLDDGGTIECERLLVAAGRTPTVNGLGLERIGVEVGEQGIVVDEYLAAAENVWAIGDVTGISLFTHVAKYQARVAASNVAGVRRAADYWPCLPSCSWILRWRQRARSKATAWSALRGRRTGHRGLRRTNGRSGTGFCSGSLPTPNAGPRRRRRCRPLKPANGSSRRRSPSVPRCPSTCFSGHDSAVPDVLRGVVLRRPRPASLGHV